MALNKLKKAYLDRPCSAGQVDRVGVMTVIFAKKTTVRKILELLQEIIIRNPKHNKNLLTILMLQCGCIRLLWAYYNQHSTVAAQARAIDRIFEILIVGAKPRHIGEAAGAKQ